MSETKVLKEEPVPKWIRLNVGGRIFMTTSNTVAQRGPNMLSKMFSNIPMKSG